MSDNVIWYWEYQLKFWEQFDKKEESACGVVAADSFTKAMEELEEYYGEEYLVEIQRLKPITDGVFEFQTAMDDEDFSYIIKRKTAEVDI